MLISDIRGAGQRALMRGSVRVTPKYTMEITLYDFDGVYATEVIWTPYLPSPAKRKALAPKINAALTPYITKSLELGGLLKRGDV